MLAFDNACNGAADDFKTDQPGTYWYHSHHAGQYPDGLRGPLIIEDPDSPHKGKWDGEFVLTLSDWYHDQMPPLIKSFLSYTNPTGAEPVPDSAVMNDMQNITFPVEPGKTYAFHIVNMGAFAAQYFWFEGHTMRIIEADGVWTNEAEAEMLYISAAQRYTVLVTMKNDTASNFAIVGSMDEVSAGQHFTTYLLSHTGHVRQRSRRAKCQRHRLFGIRRREAPSTAYTGGRVQPI